jgi:hypothetical protein
MVSCTAERSCNFCSCVMPICFASNTGRVSNTTYAKQTSQNGKQRLKDKSVVLEQRRTKKETKANLRGS